MEHPYQLRAPGLYRAPKGDLVTCDTQATASSDHPAESIQQGGLATAVRPNQAYDLVLGNLERHIVDGDRKARLPHAKVILDPPRKRSDCVTAIMPIAPVRET